jgi:hypothetical protein
MNRIPRIIRILIYIALPFVAVAGLGVRRLMARRQALREGGETAWAGFPVAAAGMAADRAECYDAATGPKEPSDPHTLRYREILQVMTISLRPPDQDSLSEHPLGHLACLGLAPR